MKWVSLQPRSYVWPSSSPAPLLCAQEMRDFTQSLSLRDCAIIALMVDAQLRSKGFRHVRVGGRLWRAVEERVVADVVWFDLNLSDIGAEIDAARFEAGDEW